MCIWSYLRSTNRNDCTQWIQWNEEKTLDIILQFTVLWYLFQGKSQFHQKTFNISHQFSFWQMQAVVLKMNKKVYHLWTNKLNICFKIMAALLVFYCWYDVDRRWFKCYGTSKSAWTWTIIKCSIVLCIFCFKEPPFFHSLQMCR